MIVIINPSEPFKGCVHSNKNAAEYQELHERNTDPVAKITQLYLRSRLVGTCVANFADKNERTIGALAAVALAVFTLYLWRATHGLRRYAGIQAGDMQQLLAAARNPAMAVALSRAAVSSCCRGSRADHARTSDSHNRCRGGGSTIRRYCSARTYRIGEAIYCRSTFHRVIRSTRIAGVLP